MKKVVLILALALTTSLTFAQDAPATPAAPEAPASKFAAAVDVVFPYLWRGFALNATDKVAFQPYASYAFTDKLTAGIWGTTNLSNDATSYNEFDVYVSYQLSPVVKLMLSDYYSDYPGAKVSYWDFKSSTQAVDLTVALNFSDKGVPLDFQWNTLIAGGDFKNNGNRNYSSYTEIGYTHSIESAGIDLRAFAGAVVNESNYYVTDGFTFSNVGLNIAKEIKISENYGIPVFVRYTYNDRGNFNKDGELKNSFISGGLTFKIK